MPASAPVAGHDDATIRRCVTFAPAWNCGGLWMVNLFAYRATHPSCLKRAADPVGPENNHTLQQIARCVELVVALHMLRLTRHGHPSHPLYLAPRLKPQPWRRG